MGLKVTTISRLPVATDRNYFIYFLDYGWDDPLVEALYANFDRLAEFAADNKSLVITGLNRTEFANEVLSWHHVNGEDATNLLPAIMIANCDPRNLAASNEFNGSRERKAGPLPSQFFLIPLRQACENAADIVPLLEQITRDIAAKRPLANFEAYRLMSRRANGLSDAVLLRPSIGGIGIDLKEAFRIGRKYFKSR